MKSLYEAEGRKAWVDLGKGISILLVVLFHCEEYLPIVDTGTAGPFSFFRMPFFFFLSGYIFVSDYTQFSLRRKLKQILRGIVWTYLIFALILVVPKSLSNGYPVADGMKMIFLGWASWFVVSLGMAQLFFALFLWRCKKQKGILMFMAGCLLAGILIKCCSESVLPFQLDKAFFVVLFFGAGFFYRIYEAAVERFVGKKYFALSIVVFLCLMLFEYRYMPQMQKGQIDKQAILGAAYEELGQVEELSVKDLDNKFAPDETFTSEALDINKDGKIDIAEYGSSIIAADMLSKSDSPDINNVDGTINKKGFDALLKYTQRSNAEAAAKLYSNIYNTYNLGEAKKDFNPNA